LVLAILGLVVQIKMYKGEDKKLFAEDEVIEKLM